MTVVLDVLRWVYYFVGTVILACLVVGYLLWMKRLGQ